MKISNYPIFAHFLGMLIWLLAPLYERLGLTEPRGIVYFGWALFFPVYLLMKSLEDKK